MVSKKNKKIILVIIDGLGDKPIKQLGNKTPLEAAKTPNLDLMAKNGVCGLVKPIYTTAIPTSEENHFSLFGYNPKVYRIDRGIFTVLGTGMKIKKGDVALRGNFGTVDKNLNMIDRRAGRIEGTKPLIDKLNGIVIDKVRFSVRSAGGYRIGILMRGKNLSSNISDGDPRYSKLAKKARKIIALDKSLKARFTAEVLNKFLEKSRQILENHPLNKKRKKSGLLPANYVLTREAGFFQKMPSFWKKYKLKACCIAGKILYQQIGEFLGMDLIKVKGANGLPNTNLKGKIQSAKKALKKYNFIFLHIKGADILAENGDFKAKREFIEKIDKNFKNFLNLKNALVVITADHSTCSDVKRHCSELIPVLIYDYGRKIGKSLVNNFSEKSCKKGKLGILKQTALMKKILSFRY